MGTLQLNNHSTEILEAPQTGVFILANTIESSLEEIKAKHIIPVYTKDNQTVISQTDFIETTREAISEIFAGEVISDPKVRVSHPIKGRTPNAKDKPAEQLMEHEKTLYYERMMFACEIPTISDEINGNLLSLTVGGVKAYNLDNLNNKKGVDETFKVFIGFRNKICTNLSVSSDGYLGDLRVKSLGELKACIKSLFESYNAALNLHTLRRLSEYSLTEKQFALMIGRARLYQHLPQNEKSEITPLLLSDTQLNTVVKDFYRDHSFCKDENGNINLWRLYNLFTGSNKSSYIDTFLDRSVNAFHFVENIKLALDHKNSNWFLN